MAGLGEQYLLQVRVEVDLIVVVMAVADGGKWQVLIGVLMLVAMLIDGANHWIGSSGEEPGA